MLAGLLATALYTVSSGSPLVELTPDDELLLGAHVALLVDAEGELTVEEALSTRGWTPSTVARPRLPAGEAVWAKLTAIHRGDATATYAIAFEHPSPYYLRAWRDDAEHTRALVFDDSVFRQIAAREVPHRRPTLELTLTPNEPVTLTFRLAGALQTLNATVSSAHRATLHEVNGTLAHGLYVGLLVALLLYHLVLFGVIGDRLYLWYALQLACTGFFFFGRAGLMNVLPGTATLGALVDGRLVEVTHVVALSVLLSTAAFGRRMLETQEALPRFDRVLRGVVIGGAVLLLLVPWASALRLPIGTLPIVLELTLLGAAVVLTRRGSAPAALYLLATCLFLLGGVLYGLKFVGVLPHTALTAGAFQIGHAVEMLLFAFALAVRVRDIARARTAAEQALREEREAALGQLVDTLERERARVGQDLHDAIGSTFARLIAIASAGRDSSVSSIAEEGLSETRRLTNALHPRRVEHLGLRRALQGLGDELRDAGVAVVDRCADLDAAVCGDRAVHVYRVAQEASQNALKHASASEIVIALAREDDDILLIVEDDGEGFCADGDHDGLGLGGMRERATLLGGTLAIDSPDGGGTLVTLRFPAAQPAD